MHSTGDEWAVGEAVKGMGLRGFGKVLMRTRHLGCVGVVRQ